METWIDSFNYYLRFYQNSAYSAWVNMGPREYTITLVTVGLFGWLLMRNNMPR